MSDEAGWSLRKEGVIVGLIVASFGGGQLLDKGHSGTLDVLTEKVASLERNVTDLRENGGPVMREATTRLRVHDDQLKDLTRDVRAGVSRDQIDNLTARIADSRDQDREIRQQLDAMRNTLDALRNEVAQAINRRLVGPAR